jgi:hypothetical protein
MCPLIFLPLVQHVVVSEAIKFSLLAVEIEMCIGEKY